MASVYNAADLKKGVKLEIDGDPWVITDFDFCKPGKGQALYRCKMKNMITGNTRENTYRSSEAGLAKAELEEKHMHYSYKDGDDYVFSDAETFEEMRVDKKTMGVQASFLIEEAACTLLMFKNRVVEITLPVFIEKEIIETEPGARGNTATNINKSARIDNGYEIFVPLFVNQGDIVKIDTRTGQYAERVRKA